MTGSTPMVTNATTTVSTIMVTPPPLPLVTMSSIQVRKRTVSEVTGLLSVPVECRNVRPRHVLNG